MESRYREYLKYFQIEDEDYTLIPITNSHINDTYCVQDSKGDNRYIIQHINSYVFPYPEKVMENMVLVTKYIQKKCEVSEKKLISDNLDNSAKSRETLRLISTKDGKSHLEIEGKHIRMFDYIQDAYSCDRIRSPEEFRQVAVAIARFHKLLSDIDVERLHITIPDFHNTPKRLEGFKKVVEEDPKGRAKRVREEIDFILQRENLAKSFEGKIIKSQNTKNPGLTDCKDMDEIDGLKLRVTHNDTKPANVMLDKHTGKALCMIDLDTVMPGVICDDFGDAIRSGACKIREEGIQEARIEGIQEEREDILQRCGKTTNSYPPESGIYESKREYTYFDKELYDVFYEAFIEECKDFLTPTEIEMLPVGAMKITYEQALRFLEDYLKGDVYFKVTDEEQNLRRARVQMNLLKEMEEALR